MFASSLYTFCCKVCNLVQTLAETQLVQSHKKATTSYRFTNLNLTQKPNELVCIQNLFLETCLETKCTLLPSLPNSIILAHIFTLLPFTPSMFWQLCRINKPWLLIMGENVPWNALEVVRINHKSYLQHVATSHTPRQSLKMWFEGKLWTLQKFMEPQNLVEPTLLSSSFNSKDNMYSNTHIPPTPQQTHDVFHL
jgi:hypothetical protein